MKRITKTIPVYFGEGAKMEMDILKEFKSYLRMHFGKQTKDLEQRALRIKTNVAFHDENNEDLYSINDYLSDLKYLYDEILKLGDMLLIVGLYRVCELSINKLLPWRYSKKALKELRDWGKIKKRMLKDKIDIEKISSYSKIDELRLLNNAIKHYGKVSPQLSKNYPKWKIGADFKNLDKKFDDFSKIVPSF